MPGCGEHSAGSHRQTLPAGACQINRGDCLPYGIPKHEIICIEKVESEHPVRMTMEVGTRRLPHAGASSKVILAYLPDEEIQDIIREKGLPKLCINTITDPGELSTELAEIRGREYALSQEETDLGAWGVATPILDRNGIAIAGIGVAGPLSRYSEERVEQHVKHCQTASHRIYTLLSTGYDTCAE
jgi:DNA-binding IclR family transcriptional regulator